MNIKTLSQICTSILLMLLLQITAQANDYTVGNLKIHHPYARATVSGQSTAGAYLNIQNVGKQEDKLVKLSSPIANAVQIHTMDTSGGVMRMRELDELLLAPSSTLSMAPGGGIHLMLTGLHAPLKNGDRFPMTLQFKNAGTVNVSVVVNKIESSEKHSH